MSSSNYLLTFNITESGIIYNYRINFDFQFSKGGIIKIQNKNQLFTTSSTDL